LFNAVEKNAVIFGGRLVALAKKDGVVRPITVAYIGLYIHFEAFGS